MQLVKKDVLAVELEEEEELETPAAPPPVALKYKQQLNLLLFQLDKSKIEM